MYQGLFKEVSASEIGKQSGLDNHDVFFRLVCALHFNGFATGVYLHLAMINHSCAPNCVKWGARDGIAHSEVRATRFIKAGEEITVSYLVPAMRSKDARHRALNGQFQFTCTCELCMKSPQFLEDGPLDMVIKLESDLEHIEEHELARRPHLALSHVLAARDEAARGGLGKRHLSLARADIIITESCLALLDDDKPGKSSPNPAGLVFTLLKSSISIRQTQCLLFQEGMNDFKATDQWVDTRSEAEPTLQHIASGIGYFIGLGKKGTDRLLTLTDDDGKQLFESATDAIQCQLACDKSASSIADFYM